MGWTTYPGDEDLWYGDDSLTLCATFLQDFVGLYAEGLGRPPRAEELRRALKTCLAVHFDEDTTPDMEQRVISDVAFTFRKWPAKIKVAVGDVFAVPLPSGGCGFGRVINLGGGYDIAEYFRHSAPRPHFVPAILSSGRVFEPRGILLSALERGAWKIVWREDGFVCPDLDALRFVMGEPGRYSLLRIGEYGKGTPVEDGEAVKYASGLPEHPQSVAQEIETALA